MLTNFLDECKSDKDATSEICTLSRATLNLTFIITGNDSYHILRLDQDGTFRSLHEKEIIPFKLRKSGKLSLDWGYKTCDQQIDEAIFDSSTLDVHFISGHRVITFDLTDPQEAPEFRSETILKLSSNESRYYEDEEEEFNAIDAGFYQAFNYQTILTRGNLVWQLESVHPTQQSSRVLSAEEYFDCHQLLHPFPASPASHSLSSSLPLPFPRVIINLLLLLASCILVAL